MSNDKKWSPAEAPYAKRLGERLRAVRHGLSLSLEGVERKSGGVWKAVVIGSYERGDRAISVARLAALAEFYGVATAELLPDYSAPPASAPAVLQRVRQALREALAELGGDDCAIEDATLRAADPGGQICNPVPAFTLPERAAGVLL